MSIERGVSTRLSLKNITKKIGLRNKDYSKVEDLYDTRVPLHNEDAFSHGLRFKAKFIGSLEISKPTCKVDIITTMRRIRYEFKVKGIRKVRSNIMITTQGVKVTKRKRKRSRRQYTEEQLFIMQHPIYRIFYVSHDSQDMKIFSYITRELPDSTFRCNVFKAYKKNMALHIVRSLGQAFDVCHRLNPRPKKTKKEVEAGEEEGEKGEEEAGVIEDKEEKGGPVDGSQSQEVSEGKQQATQPQTAVQNDLIGLDFDPFSFNYEAPAGAGMLPNGAPQMAFESSFTSGGVADGFPPTAFPPLMVSSNPSGLPELPMGTSAAQTQLQLTARPRPRPATTNQQNVIQENPFTADMLRTGSESPALSIGEAIDGPEKMISNPFLTEQPGGEQPPSSWEIYRQQMVAQMALMSEQLKRETTARIESEARVEHLLTQNKQLLTHVQKLMVELEKLQSLQMAQLMASGVQPPSGLTAAPASTAPAPEKQTNPSPTVPETLPETKPAPISSDGPESAPPPPPETPQETSDIPAETQPLLSEAFMTADSTPSQETSDIPAETQPLLSEAFTAVSSPKESDNAPADSSSTSTTTVTTDSEQPPTPFDVPPTTPLLPPSESTPPQSSTPVPEESLEFPLTDATDLPTNDPFAPQ